MVNPGIREALMRKIGWVAALAVVALAVTATSAVASRPVRRMIVGCVIDVTFFSEDGYVIRVFDRANAPVDLTRWRGRRLGVEGWLSPGDRFNLDGTPRVLGPCKPVR